MMPDAGRWTMKMSDGGMRLYNFPAVGWGVASRRTEWWNVLLLLLLLLLLLAACRGFGGWWHESEFFHRLFRGRGKDCREASRRRWRLAF